MRTPTEVVASVSWLEGPSAVADGSVYFSDVKANRLYHRAPGGELRVYRDPANYANGTAIDGAGHLIVCELGNDQRNLPPRVTRTDLSTSEVEVLVDAFDGLPLLGPNDISYTNDGRLYFRDGDRPPFLPVPARRGMVSKQKVGVYCIHRDGRTVRIIESPAICQPNGIGTSPDGKHLYLIEDDPTVNGLRQLLRFDLHDDGAVANRVILHDFRPGRGGDSMTVDREGQLLVAAGLNSPRGSDETLSVRTGIHIFSSDGAPIGFIPIEEDSVTNITQSIVDPREFFVTAGKRLFSIRPFERPLQMRSL